MSTRRTTLGARYTRLAAASYPRGYPLVQFPNPPLLIAIAAALAGGLTEGDAHGYARGAYYIAIAIWAYGELAHGVNWFRRALGLAILLLTLFRIAHALDT